MSNNKPGNTDGKERLKATANKQIEEWAEKQRDLSKKQREKVSAALNVDGYTNPVADFNDDIFLLDNWTEDEGLCYLTGIASIKNYNLDNSSSVNITTLEGMPFLECENVAIVSEFRSKLNRLERIWRSGSFPESNPSSFYINWALSKGITIPWLQYAIDKGFYESPQDDLKKKVPSDEPTNKERTSMLKIINALAKNAYKYPSRSSLKEMIEDFERNDNGVSEKTLKKYLDEATKL